MNTNNYFPEFGGSTGGWLEAAETEEKYVMTWTKSTPQKSVEANIFEMPTGDFFLNDLILRFIILIPLLFHNVLDLKDKMADLDPGVLVGSGSVFRKSSDLVPYLKKGRIRSETDDFNSIEYRDTVPTANI